MKAFILAPFIVSFAWASEVCVTHGQCQDLYHGKQTVCLKVITGSDYQQNPTCRVTCSEMTVSGFCEKIPGKFYGVCRKEELPKYSGDNCEDAIPAEILNN